MLLSHAMLTERVLHTLCFGGANDDVVPDDNCISDILVVLVVAVVAAEAAAVDVVAVFVVFGVF